MRLIDVDALIDYLDFDNTEEEREENVGEIVVLEDFDRQPTVFDVEKVMESLEREKSESKRLLNENMGTGYEFASKCRLDAYKKAVDIVKEGGIE